MIGYGIIGCGRISQNHVVSIARNPNARLVAVADISPSALERARTNCDVRCFNDYQNLLSLPEVDAVSICLPHHLHEPAVLACAGAGKHVLCEKPIAMDHAGAVRMIDACREAGVTFGVVLQNRYNEATLKVQEAIDAGRFGRIITGTMLQAVHKNPSYYHDDWHGRWATEGGGSLLTQSIHTLDLLCKFIGRPASVRAYADTLIHDIEVEDTCAASIRFDSGAMATVATTNLALHEWWQRLDILGTHGAVTIEDNKLVKWEFADGVLDDSIGEEDSLDDSLGARGYGTSHPKIINDFITSIIERKPFAVSGEEALTVSDVIWAIYRSARSGRDELVS